MFINILVAEVLVTADVTKHQGLVKVHFLLVLCPVYLTPRRRPPPLAGVSQELVKLLYGRVGQDGRWKW